MDSLLIEKDEQAQLGKYIDEAHLGVSKFNKNDQNCKQTNNHELLSLYFNGTKMPVPALYLEH